MRIAGLQSRQVLHKARPLQRGGADVHPHRQHQPLLLPARQLLEHLGQHPFVQLGGQGLPLQHRQKVAGCQQPFVGVLPADQRLGPHQLAGVHVHLGLVEQHHFVATQGLVYAVDLLAAALDGVVGGHVEQVITVFARLLGLVHGLVGMAHELLGIGTVLRVQGHTQAGRYLQARIAHLHRLGRGLQQPGQHGFAGVVGAGQRGQHGHKLIAAHACQGVALAQHFFQALGQGNQQLVAHRVAVLVVDGLEAVQIEKHHRHRQARALALHHRLAQPIRQQNPVGQLGERVKVGNVLQGGLVFFLGRDVVEQAQVMQRSAVLVFHHADGEQLGVQAAVFAAVPQLAVPVALGAQSVPDVGVKRRLVPPRLEQARVLAHHLLRGVAGDAGEGVVDHHDVALRIGDENAFAGMREHAGRQPELGLVALALADFAGHQHKAGGLAAAVLIRRLGRHRQLEIAPSVRIVDVVFMAHRGAVGAGVLHGLAGHGDHIGRHHLVNVLAQKQLGRQQQVAGARGVNAQKAAIGIGFKQQIGHGVERGLQVVACAPQLALEVA